MHYSFFVFVTNNPTHLLLGKVCYVKKRTGSVSIRLYVLLFFIMYKMITFPVFCQIL
jgi:hypothetical protein